MKFPDIYPTVCSTPTHVAVAHVMHNAAHVSAYSIEMFTVI